MAFNNSVFYVLNKANIVLRCTTQSFEDDRKSVKIFFQRLSDRRTIFLERNFKKIIDPAVFG